MSSLIHAVKVYAHELATKADKQANAAINKEGAAREGLLKLEQTYGSSPSKLNEDYYNTQMMWNKKNFRDAHP